jgi:uncharacterized coiled-coil DUF342 family protein
MSTVKEITAQLDELLPKLEAEKQRILDSLTPEYTERDELNAKMQPLEARMREVQKVIKEKERPLREIGNSIAEIHRVKGAKTLRNG